jgi:hypothetical protein
MYNETPGLRSRVPLLGVLLLPNSRTSATTQVRPLALNQTITGYGPASPSASKRRVLGTSSPVNDVNGDGTVNVVDLQTVINAALGLGCSV